MANFDAVIAAVILLLALVVPVFTSSRMLNATQFKLVPLTPRRVGVMVVLSSLLSWALLLLILWLGTNVWMRSTDPVSAVIGSAGALIFVLTVTLTSHIAAQSSEILFHTPRTQAVKTLLGWLLLISAAPLIIFVFTSGGFVGFAAMLTEIGKVVEFTPLGAALSATDSYVTGGVVPALIKLGVALLTLVILGYVWLRQVRFTFTFSPKPGAEPLTKSGLGWFERFPSTPTGVIGARSVTYWMRDPRYRLSFAAVPVVVVVAMLAMFIAGAPVTLVWVMPLTVVSFFLGWSIHNDVATDSTAIWMHVASNTPGRADRLGRLTPILLAGIPLIIVGSTLSIALMGDWRPLPAVIGVSASLLLTSAGVSSFASARWPYPTSRPGESLFVQPQYAGFGAGKVQTFTVLITIALALPALVTGFIGIGTENLVLQLVSLVLGLAGGATVLYFGLKLGADAFNQEGPELIALSQIFD
jgi:ABC-2 type transport system permease protein